MAALAIRQAARNKGIKVAGNAGIPQWNDYAVRLKAQDVKSPVFIATPFSTKLDELAEKTYHATYPDIAKLGFAVASMIYDSSPVIEGLSEVQQELAQRIATVLREAEKPLVITGTHGGSEDLLHAAANIANALSLNGKKCSLSFVPAECNSMGLGMMDGKSFMDAADLTANGGIDTLVILENDLYRRADKKFVDALFEKCKTVIVLDHLVNNTTVKADILLPVGTFAESEGTLVNHEGRAQRFYRVFPLAGPVIESWRQIRDLIKINGKTEAGTWENFDDVVTSMSDSIPAFSKIKGHMPDADFRILSEKIKRQTIRFSGRTAMNANIAVSESKTPIDPDSPLAFSMEGADETPPSSLVSNYWAPGWNSSQAMNFYLNEPNGSMKGGDPGIRLFETASSDPVPFFPSAELYFRPVAGEWMIVPVYQIFGSEELSSKGTAIAKRIASPFLLMNNRDAEGSGIKENDLITLLVSDKTIEVTLKIDESIPAGIAGLSAGLPGMPFLELPGPGWLTLKSG